MTYEQYRDKIRNKFLKNTINDSKDFDNLDFLSQEPEPDLVNISAKEANHPVMSI